MRRRECQIVDFALLWNRNEIIGRIAMKLRNNKVDKDTSYFPCYRITQGCISFYIYKTTIKAFN